MSTEDEYNRLLKQFPEKLKNVLNWKKYFERLVQVGRRTGRSDIQIGDEIRKELKGEIDDRVIRRYLPESMKHMEHDYSKINRSVSASPEPEREPELPPPPQVIREVHIESDSPPQVNADPIMDCNKFRNQLRMALLNGSKIRLKINNLNEVVEIIS